MLKLTYTEVGLYMEQTKTLPETLISQRVVLAMRLGEPLYVEPGHASFLLPADLPELRDLETALQREGSPAVTVMPVDQEFVEVGISGSWVAAGREAHAGTFLTVMGDRAEFFIYKLWQMSAAHLSSLTQ